MTVAVGFVWAIRAAETTRTRTPAATRILMMRIVTKSRGGYQLSVAGIGAGYRQPRIAGGRSVAGRG